MVEWIRIAAVVTTLSCLVAACGGGNDNDRGQARATPTPVATPSPTLAAAILVGVYDATVHVGDRTFASNGVIRECQAAVEITVRLGPDAGMFLSGRTTPEGRLSGTGSVGISDVAFTATGEAAFTVANGIHTVTGTVHAPTALSVFAQPIAFTMRRPAGAAASAFDGTYRFALTRSPSECVCSTALDLTLSFADDGFGAAPRSTERDAAGTPVATVLETFATLSPEGRLRIDARYEPTQSTTPIEQFVTFIGELQRSESGVTGAGETYTAFVLSVGTWTAERID